MSGEFYAPETPDLPEHPETDAPEPTDQDDFTETGSSYEYVDTDGDGYAETTVIDSNADGEVDAVLTDVDGDFYDDIAQFDNTPGDGEFTPDVIAVATGGDGLADVVIDDTNLDGIYDTVTPGHDEPLPYANPYETSAGVAPTETPVDEPFEQRS
ncbi:hypothetical protein [Pseudonocardia broussonetiae]|uniref:hypothetical protein n=1 Tax=Pseudonocardia broussonetiae TaxID=2736640 RepID=UPI001965F01C|nr:hypothetical protein [Pseudonocardia broussonetiae]